MFILDKRFGNWLLNLILDKLFLFSEFLMLVSKV
jgi:hypothetical protein